MSSHPSVLVVEDDPDNLELLVEALAMAGFSVTAASSGDEAVRATQASCPDAIVMNVHLGEGPDGLAVTRRLRANAETANIAIVATSSHCQQTDREAALQAGCDDFLAKPFNLSVLEHQLRRLISGKSV